VGFLAFFLNKIVPKFYFTERIITLTWEPSEPVWQFLIAGSKEAFTILALRNLNQSLLMSYLG
jgi:hypothetical protein